jgi:hypothetical protein
LNLIDEKTRAKCPKELQEVEKYTKVEQIGKSFNVTILPGKEQEAQKAFAELNQCQGAISQYTIALDTFSQYNLAIISGTVENCIDDCEKSFNTFSKEQLRNCVKNCYNFTFKYTLKMVENLLNQQMDAGLEELKKI